MTTSTSCAVVVGGGELAEAAAKELHEVLGCVEQVQDLAHLPGWDPPPDRWVALVLLLDDDDLPPTDDVVTLLSGQPAFSEARVLVVTTRSSLTDISGSVDSGRIDGVVAAPWTPGNIARYAAAQVSRASALTGRPGPGGRPVSELQQHFAMDADAAAAELLELLESVLGPRPRVHLRAGVRIAVPEGRVTQVFLVVRGRVALTVTSEAGEVILHHASTGPLVGLLALTEMTHSTVTARTTTACEMVALTLEQLDYALSRDPRIGTTLTALSLRALATRLRRSEQLHVKNAALTAELRTTLAELRAARAELVDQARMATLGELAAGIAHELNNPAATVTRGVDHLSADLRRLLAHEPPAAGWGRTLVQRLRAVRDRFGTQESGGARRGGARGDAPPPPRPRGLSPVLDAFVVAEERDHVPAREERALRRALGNEVQDRALVRRLVAAGVTDPELARELIEGPPELLARVESAAGIGSALRAVRVAGHHIATLVSTLHTHARPDSSEGELVAPTQVESTVQDALRLLEHRLRQVPVEVQVEADDDLPPVLSGPGLLTQVWTNLLSNAAEAIARQRDVREGTQADPGRITVRVSSWWRPDPPREALTQPTQDPERSGVFRPVGPVPTPPHGVLVEVEDDGPGVPEDLREQIFTPRFTTRRGVVRYGLGLGLGIARSIVSRHGGRIALDSRPGRTVFSVVLPAADAPPLTVDAEREEEQT